jgi:AI-2 transport protein TqsA
MALLMGGWGDAAIVLLCYVLVNFAIGNGIEPIFLGKQFGIATSVVLPAVLFWGWVWGPCGMLLAVPIMVLIKLALENSRDLSWVATIISDEPPPHVTKLKNKTQD